ncbi:MAG TPA: hypothetical protein VIX63_15940 [Vicinamibacterales bacterium]
MRTSIGGPLSSMIGRRRVLQLAGGLGTALLPPGVRAAGWRVGVARSTDPGTGQQTGIDFLLVTPGETHLDILSVSEISPNYTVVRTLRDWTPTNPGLVTATWDGRDHSGALAGPAFYLIRARARDDAGDTILAISSGGVFVSP